MRRLSWMAITCVGLWACSNGSGTPEVVTDVAGDSPADADTFAPVSADKACTDVATARCARRQSCSDDTWAARNYGDAAVCGARMREACLASLGAPDTGATAARTEACAQVLPDANCDDLYNNIPQMECEPAVGSLAAGAPCVYNGQCLSSFCHVPHGAACGTCATMPVEGAVCAETAECGTTGQECIKAKGETTGTCQVPAADGGLCDKTHSCGHGLGCVGATTTAGGTCQATGKTLGATCDAKRQAAPDCDLTLGLACDATGKCVASVLVGEGDSCDGRLTVCGSGGRCDFAAQATTGTCHLPAADGGVCGLDQGAPCLGPARCIVPAVGQTTGTCQAPQADACVAS